MSAIFISHSSHDRDAAGEIRSWLDEQGHRSVFLDFDPEGGIVAGQDWEQTLYREIKGCRAVIVLCSVASMDSKWCFTEITHARAMGKELFPVRIDDCVVQGVFSDRQVVDYAEGKDQALERLRLGLLAAGLDPDDAFDWDNSRPPYPGLIAFQEPDAAIYFGRDDEISEGLDRLGKIHRLGTTAMLMILGASGTGKSSLVRAGLVPRVRPDKDRWIVLDPIRPHADIIGEIAYTFARAFEQTGDPATPAELAARLSGALDSVGPAPRSGTEAGAPSGHAVFQGDENPLLALADDLRRSLNQPDARVLLIIDQFEELLGHPESTATPFLATLRHAIERPDSPLVTLGTMRSDFLGDLQENPALIHLDTETLSLGPMPANGFVDMIAKPAALAGIELEEGLVAEMVGDAESGGALPLLAFTLQQLHQRYGSDNRLELSEYRDRLGGLHGSIAKVADELVRGVDRQHLDLLRTAFLSMTRVTEDGVFARRPQREDSIPTELGELIAQFVDSGLLVSRGDGDTRTVEVAHEALYTSWSLLEGWLKQSAEALRLEHDIDVASRQWEAGGKLEEDLLRGGRLERSRELIDSGDLPLADLDLEFIEASEQAERAEAERAARRHRRVLQAVSAGLIVAVVLVGVATVAWQRAVRASERAAAARLTTVAQASAETETELGMLTAVASLGITPSPRAWSALATALSQPILARSPLDGHVAAVSSVAVSPDGTLIASADWDGTVRMWDLATGASVGEPFTEDQPLWANATAFSPDGTTVAIGGFGASESGGFGGVWLRDASTGNLVTQPLAGHGDEVMALAYSPDGAQLVSGSLDGAVLLWDLTGPTPAAETLLDPLDRLGDQASTIEAVAISPDGSTIIAGGYDPSDEDFSGALWVFDAQTRTHIETVAAHFLDVLGVAYSADGRWFASVSADGEVLLWDAGTFEIVNSALVGGGEVWGLSVAFSSDGNKLATGNSDGSVSVFDTEPFELVNDPLAAHLGDALSVAFGPGVLVSGGADNAVRVFDLDAGQSLGREVLVSQDVWSWSEFAPDGAAIASVGFDDSIRLWDAVAGTATGDPLFLDPDSFVDLAALSPDGRLIAASTFGFDVDSTVVLLDATTGEAVGDPLVAAQDITWLAFSPDGVHLAISDLDGVVEVWDLRLGPALLGTINEPEGGRWLGFSRDGGMLVSGDFEGNLRLWDTTTFSQIGATLTGHTGSINDVAFAPGGELMASASDDKTVRLWDLESMEQVGEPLAGHGGRVLSVAFSPDGTGLASSGQDTTVVLRRLDDVDDPITLLGHRGPVLALSFSADGSRVVSADENGAIRSWPTPDRWQQLACDAAGRNLSLAEWERIVGADRGYERQCPDYPPGTGAPEARVVTVEY